MTAEQRKTIIIEPIKAAIVPSDELLSKIKSLLEKSSNGQDVQVVVEGMEPLSMNGNSSK